MNLIHVKSWNIERGQDIDAAMLMGSFTRYLYRDLAAVNVPDRPSFHEGVNTCFDRLHGGCLFLSFTALAVLEELIDWDRWGEVGGGVFAYEHLEADDTQRYTEGTDLAAFLLREIPAVAWYNIAENWDVPNNTELTDLLTRWAAALKLPLVDSAVPLPPEAPEPDRRCDSLPYDFEDFGLNLTELQDKYATEKEHPEYTNGRWGREAPTTPYWDWVMARIAEDDDATE
jgi:hypothetical protein